MYASSWFLTLFLTTFPLPVATRVFDIFMYEVTGPRQTPAAQRGGKCSPCGAFRGETPNPSGAGGWER